MDCSPMWADPERSKIVIPSTQHKMKILDALNGTAMDASHDNAKGTKGSVNVEIG